MDKVLKYGDCVRRVLEQRAHPSSDATVETQLIMDETRDHYLLLYVGWCGHDRVRGSVLHIDIKDGRIWIQHDGTEDGVANDLVEMGVPKEDIVLGFQHPEMRALTDFAVA